MATTKTSIDVGELVERLRDCCDRLFHELFADAHVDGGELCGHMSDGHKVKMAVRGNNRGEWLNCHIAGQCGDPLDLITLRKCHGNTRRSFAWACDYLGIGNTNVVTPRASARSPIYESQDDRKQRARNPLGFYLRAVESAIVTSYLKERLRVPVEQLPKPRCLRLLARCWHTESNSWLPAMVAPVIHLASHMHISTHRTWLMQDHSGVWRKATVDPVKKALGSFRGGVIPLLRGVSGRPLKEAQDGETVLIAEGIENALAAAYLTRAEQTRVWAAVSVNNLKHIALAMPQQFSRVVIVKDNDPGNAMVADALRETVDLLIDQGRDVESLSAPSRYKDMVEFLSHEGPITRGDVL
jgi:hypothetical protein